MKSVYTRVIWINIINTDWLSTGKYSFFVYYWFTDDECIDRKT